MREGHTLTCLEHCLLPALGNSPGGQYAQWAPGWPADPGSGAQGCAQSQSAEAILAPRPTALSTLPPTKATGHWLNAGLAPPRRSRKSAASLGSQRPCALQNSGAAEPVSARPAGTAPGQVCPPGSSLLVMGETLKLEQLPSKSSLTRN